jgi:hypothetical protein
MRRLVALLTTLTLVLGVAAAPALAADGDDITGRVMLVAGGDVTVAAGEEAAVVIVAQGHADVAGTVGTLVVLDGTAATSEDARLDSVVLVNGTLDLSAGTTVTRDVAQLNSTVNRAEDATIEGSVTDLAADAAAFGVFVGFASLMLWLGFGVATILVGLVAAALAARQVRAATAYISRQPGTTFLAGLLAAIALPVVAVLALLTVVGIPTGFALLFVVWPAVGFVGYLVAAIWIGEWLVNRGGATPPERPYLASVIGILVVTVLGFVPLITLIVSMFGLGAVVRAAWATVRGATTRADARGPGWIPA